MIFKEVLKIIKSKFVGANVIIIEDKYGKSIKVTHSTGKYSVSSLITSKLIARVKNINEICGDINKRHHYDLMKKIFKDYYESHKNDNPDMYLGDNIILDIVCPEDMIFRVMHPSKYVELRENSI
jgi:hypothetical protein